MDGRSNGKHSLSLQIFLDSSEALHGEQGPGRQGHGKLSSGQERRRQECTVVMSPSHWSLQCWDGGAASVVGCNEKSQCGLCFQERMVRASTGRTMCRPPRFLGRHSTRKRTSTTSRTTKRMAMAHHWRRSARQDTRVSSQDSAYPEPVT